MDEATFHILDILSGELGNPISIHELTKKIEEKHGAAYYANIYEKIHSMVKEKIIDLQKVGRSSIATLNFKNYFLVDRLGLMELQKKINLLEKHTELQILLMEIDTYFKDLNFINSISLISFEKNIKLNRIELMILVKNPEKKSILEETIVIHKIMHLLQRMHNIRIDYLVLNNKTFIDVLGREETNPVREMLSNKIVMLYMQTFWMEIRDALEKGINIRFEEVETSPAKITNRDLVYNLARFGYTEMGPHIEQGKPICIEYIITSVLLQNDARRIDAIPVMLAKNEDKINYNLLVFISQKYGLSDRLLGLLKVLNKVKPTKETEETIDLMNAMKVKEVKADQKSIEEKMRLYNVT